MGTALEKPRLRVPGSDVSAEDLRRLNPTLTAYTGADMTSRELGGWHPQNLSGDAAILPERTKLTGRAQDLTRNNGYAVRINSIRTNSLVGPRYKLSYKPNWLVLGVDPESKEATDFVRQVEAYWSDYADDPECRIDVEQKRTFTQIIRDGVASVCDHGEILNVAEYVRRQTRGQLQTAIKVVNSERLSTPITRIDNQYLRAGVKRNSKGAAVGYWIREVHPNDAKVNGLNISQLHRWKYVPIRKRWGRMQVLHLFNPVDDGASRGVTTLAPAIQRLKMIDRYQGVELEKHIIHAMYAMVIESEFDPITAVEALGGEHNSGKNNPLLKYMQTVNRYHSGADITFNGVKIPHLFPNEKIHLLGTDAPQADAYEQRLLRYVAASAGVSYEQLSMDWTATNFSSGKAATGEAWRVIQGDKPLHDRHASMIFSLVLEEMFSKGLVKPPKNAPDFYTGKSAWCRSYWIGAGKTMVDGLKEVKEIILRLEAGLITYEKACALLGEDYQEILDQQIKEIRERKAAGLPPPSYMMSEAFAPEMPDANNPNPQTNTNSQTA